MNRSPLLLLTAALLATAPYIPCSGAAETVAAPPAKVATSVDQAHPLLATRVERLDNGLTVVLHQDKRAPVVELQLWYRIGAIDEPAGLTGISHALEHMMFRGSATVAPGEYSRRIAQLGGHTNAFTTRDYTYYYAAVPASDLGVALQLEADRMQHLSLADTQFATEIEVVKEERRLSTENNAFRAFSERLQDVAYPESVMRNPVIGYMDDLKKLKGVDLRSWYQQWYAPNNAILVLAGEFEPEAVLTQIRDHFGKMAARALPARGATTATPQGVSRRLKLKQPSSSSLITYQWRLPNDLTIEDAAAFSVLAEMLSNDYQDRLLALASDSVYAGFDYPTRGEPAFTLSATPSSDSSLSDLESAMDQQVNLLHGAGLYGDMLNRAKQRILARHYYAYDNLSTRAHDLGEITLYGMTPQQYVAFQSRMQQVSLDDIERVSERYLDKSSRVVGVLEALPLKDAPTVSQEVTHGR